MIGMARRSTAKGFSEPKTPYSPPRKGSEQVKEIAQAKRGLPAPEMLPDGTTRYFLVVGPKGRVLLPADMRHAMGLTEGDVITAWLKGAELRLHSHRHGLQTIQDEAASRAQGRAYASDELIAERRAEAAKEAEEELLWLRNHPTKRKRR
jgi:bifunctional DNA-binding transcriptional regulator/antitoxin component of YhaV-PrlF toxin-antitoxin module